MGKTHKFGNNIDTDLIIPARYLNSSDEKHLAMHCMEDADINFAKNVQHGDIIVAEENFGCGSSREHAPLAIKSCGITCVIAKSFARIFYRNAINIGLPIMECPEAVDNINVGNEVLVNLTNGEIYDATSGKKYYAKPFPPFIKKIIDNGGLLNCVNEFSKGETFYE